MILKKAAIVIHIFRQEISNNEKISLQQLRKVLGYCDAYLIAPENLEVTQYEEILQSQLKEIIRFPEKYFKDLQGYNHLLLSKSYYAPFLKYDYMLLHHTDAFVFRDELDHWMNKDYDSIGAPIYGYDGTMHPTEYICIGNGGLNLRKVKTFYDLAGSSKVIYGLADILKDFRRYNWKGKLARSWYYLGLLTTLGARLNPDFNVIRENEDVIWGYHVPKHFRQFKAAPFEDALKFSMEFNCDKLLEQNNNALPSGCHGWLKPMFISFWKPYIEAQGHKVDVGA